jgi:diacylglycerol O-acyltransferase / wax synthase
LAIERLSPEDLMMLWPDQIWPQDIGVVGFLDGADLFDDGGDFRIEAIREAVAARLDLVPRFRQLLCVPPRAELGGPCWVDDPELDIRNHVHVRALQEASSEADLLAVVEGLRSVPLERGRPLWELWLLPGLPDRRVGMFARTHHTVADGMAGVAALAALLESEAGASPGHPGEWTPAPSPTEEELLADARERARARRQRRLSALRHPIRRLGAVASALPAIHEILAERSVPPTSLTRLVGGGRKLAIVRASLDDVKAVAHEHDAKVNDVLLAVIAGALRRLFAARSAPIPDVVRAYVPVSLRHGQYANATGNRIAQMMLPLPTAAADAPARLELVARETTRRKAMARPALDALPAHGLAGRVALKLIDRQHVNVTTADLPGPPLPMYLAGAPLLELTPVIPLIGKVSLGVGAISYAGQFNIGVVADRDAHPDLDVLVSAMTEELRALGLPTRLAEVA